MWNYLLRRFLTMIVTVWVISVIVFVVIQLPPGDYVSNIVNQIISQSGQSVDPRLAEQLRELYGLDEPVHVQYLRWLRNIITRGRFGYSFLYERDAIEVIAERLPMTFAISLSAFMFVWMVSLPAGVYS
ncbi:MAG: ABC transporter permease, partial [Spirochaetota bacterium]